MTSDTTPRKCTKCNREITCVCGVCHDCSTKEDTGNFDPYDGGAGHPIGPDSIDPYGV